MVNRLKNYGLWLSILAFIPILLKGFGIDVLPSNYDQLVSSFLGILVLAGILNNPTTENSSFLDDKKITAAPQTIDPTNITNDMK